MPHAQTSPAPPVAETVPEPNFLRRLHESHGEDPKRCMHELVEVISEVLAVNRRINKDSVRMRDLFQQEVEHEVCQAHPMPQLLVADDVNIEDAEVDMCRLAFDQAEQFGKSFHGGPSGSTLREPAYVGTEHTQGRNSYTNGSSSASLPSFGCNLQEAVNVAGPEFPHPFPVGFQTAKPSISFSAEGILRTFGAPAGPQPRENVVGRACSYAQARPFSYPSSSATDISGMLSHAHAQYLQSEPFRSQGIPTMPEPGTFAKDIAAPKPPGVAAVPPVPRDVFSPAYIGLKGCSASERPGASPLASTEGSSRAAQPMRFNPSVDSAYVHQNWWSLEAQQNTQAAPPTAEWRLSNLNRMMGATAAIGALGPFLMPEGAWHPDAELANRLKARNGTRASVPPGIVSNALSAPARGAPAHIALSPERLAYMTSPPSTPLFASSGAWTSSPPVSPSPPIHTSAVIEPGVDLETIAEDVRTLIIRNIPARCTQGKLLSLWPPTGVYNILHLPYSQTQHRTLGYAFVNFVSRDAILDFCEKWHGSILVPGSGTKRLSVALAEVQGFDGNIRHMKCNAKIRNIKSKRHMPVIINADGSFADFREVMKNWDDGKNEEDGSSQHESSAYDSFQQHESANTVSSTVDGGSNDMHWDACLEPLEDREEWLTQQHMMSSLG